MTEGRMTLQQAIDHTWEVYQKHMLASAWATLENKESCSPEEHKQLHEWLSKLKKISRTYADYECGVYDDADTAMDEIGDILKEGEGV